ncbi:MAG: isopenicillin N synthase family oxygenase, partial [Comamonadaceae bacterium]
MWLASRHGMTLPIARLPVVDLHGCRAGGDAGAQACAARAIDAACRDTGFLVLEQHGVPDAVLDDAFEAAFAFFDAPQAVRDSARPPDRRVRGYTPLQGQRLARSLQHETPPDLFERFRLGPFDHAQDAYHQERAQGWFAPNVWPPALPRLRTALEAYY